MRFEKALSIRRLSATQTCQDCLVSPLVRRTGQLLIATPTRSTSWVPAITTWRRQCLQAPMCSKVRSHHQDISSYPATTLTDRRQRHQRTCCLWSPGLNSRSRETHRHSLQPQHRSYLWICVIIVPVKQSRLRIRHCEEQAWQVKALPLKPV